MKIKGKINNIIFEEKINYSDNKGYDYCELKSLNEKGIKYLLKYFAIWLIPPTLLIIFSEFINNKIINIILGILSGSWMIFYMFYVIKKEKYKYFITDLIPLKKPHNFKKEDIVEVEINVKKADECVSISVN